MYRLLKDILAAFPSKNDHENTEAGRLLAMLEVDHAEAIPKVLGMITADSHPTQDFHYLIVLSRLKGARTAKHVQLIGDALLDLERKLDGRNLRVKQTWNARFGELAIELLKSNPGMEKLLGEHKDLVRPGHVVVAAVFKGEARILAARRFLNVVKVDVEFPMSAELIDLLAILPPADFAPVFRAHWADRPARDAMVKLLARQPDPADRTKFLDVVESGSADAARLSLNALALLNRDDNAKNLVPLFSRLRQAFAEPKEAELRKDLIAAINRQSGQSFRFNEVKTDAAVLAIAYQPLNDWFAKTHPAEAKALTTSGEDEEAVRKIMATVNWEAGNAERGSKVFRDRSCLACHGGSTRLGPDLKGVGGRLSRDDLFTSIINPSRDVAPAYRVTNVDLKDGKRLSGLIVFESADGLIVQTGAAETRRIATSDIESRTPSARSLMPDGLLKGLRPEDLADLYAFMRKQ